jgi:cytochrome c oxidase accessory protein FixG
MSQTSEDSFRDTVSHIDREGKRVWFFPKQPSGRFYQWRTWVSWLYIVLFFALPFFKWKGDPLFLFDLIDRKFILFGVRFWPQDFFIFMIGMITFIIFIALFTVVYGRVFCGWICPQTIFMEMIFRKIEYFIDGNASRQKQLKNGPWNSEKIKKRLLKIILFLLISFLVAHTMLAYLIGIDDVYQIITEPATEHIGGLLSMCIFTLLFFFVYYWFREQACLVVCPYGRMQGVLLDRHSILVAYDYKRGEPRHKGKSNETGDCVDCGECVRVCPTGIDIRHGTQLECVNCTACIDACDHVMQGIQKPKGLIRYASENSIAEGRKLRLTSRIVAYTIVLLMLVGLESFLLITRSDLDIHVVRPKGTLFYRPTDSTISNLYNVKIVNKTRDTMPIQVIEKNFGGRVQLVGDSVLIVPPDTVIDAQFFVELGLHQIPKQKSIIHLSFDSEGVSISTEKTTFLGPANKTNTKIKSL